MPGSPRLAAPRGRSAPRRTSVPVVRAGQTLGGILRSSFGTARHPAARTACKAGGRYPPTGQGLGAVWELPSPASVGPDFPISGNPYCVPRPAILSILRRHQGEDAEDQRFLISGVSGMTLRVVPLTLKQANACVAAWHRHHKPARGHRFSIGAWNGSAGIVGAAIIGRPVAPKTDQYRVCEVTRLTTDGTRNACSLLYSAAARAARAIGFAHIQTFILESEDGASLRASGWEFDGWSDGADGWQSRDGRRSDQPTCRKARWIKRFPENQ